MNRKNNIMLFGIGTLAMAVMACDPNEEARVHVHYDQSLNFGTYALSSDSSSTHGASPDGIFIMYRITRIENTGTEAKAFVFGAHKVLLATGDQITNEEAGSDEILLGGQLFDGVTVPPGQVLTDANGLGCIIKIARSDDLQSLTTTSSLVDASHQIDADQPVSMHRVASDTDVGIVIGAATPTLLQTHCDTL